MKDCTLINNKRLYFRIKKLTTQGLIYRVGIRVSIYSIVRDKMVWPCMVRRLNCSDLV